MSSYIQRQALSPPAGGALRRSFFVNALIKRRAPQVRSLPSAHTHTHCAGGKKRPTLDAVLGAVLSRSAASAAVLAKVVVGFHLAEVRGVVSSIMRSTCSSDRPLVSGMRKYEYTKAQVQRPPHTKKTGRLEVAVGPRRPCRG